LRILHLVTRRQHRGAEVFAAQLADGLIQEGHDARVVGLYEAPDNPLVPLLAAAEDLDGPSNRPLSYALVSKLVALIREYRPDLVQANGSATLKYSALARRLSGGRWPLVYRNISIASEWVRNPAHRLYVQWLVSHVTHVAAVSNKSEADFRDTYRLPGSRISTIPIGVHVPTTPRLPALREQLLEMIRASRDAELLLHVGSFSPEKNHIWMIDAFAQILAERSGAHLVLVGDGPLRPRVGAYIADRGLQARVHMFGTRGDVPTLVGGADVLLLPSSVEGIPGVILEAAAQAVPTVATDVGSVSEAVDDGRSGVLVPPGDIVAFTAAVTGLFADPSKRRRMGVAAYRLVKERYSMERIVARFQRLYEHLCGRESSAEQQVQAWGAWT
jgi:glycosyltransferase involved in cell wall biosynthesis